MPETDDEATEGVGAGSLRIAAVAVSPRDGIIVGGSVHGPAKFGGRQFSSEGTRQGFVGSVGQRGEVRKVQFIKPANRDDESLRGPDPRSLVVEPHGDVILSQSDSTIARVRRSGERAVLTTALPTAHAMMLAPDGDMILSGCTTTEVSVVNSLMPRRAEKRGYVARISPTGTLRWSYRFRPDDAVDQSSREDCGTAVAAAPEGDIYVAGRFVGVPKPAIAGPSWPAAGSFLARFSSRGDVVWSRLLWNDDARVVLARLSDGSVAASARASVGGQRRILLVLIDRDGKEVWRESAKAERETASMGEPALASKRDAIFWAASYTDVVAIANASLQPPAGQQRGLFVAEFDASGKLVSLTNSMLTSRAKCTLWEEAVNPIGLIPTASSLWVIGNVGLVRSGVFVQRLDW